MSNDLASLTSALVPEGANLSALAKSKFGDDKSFAAVASGGFLPRVQLCGSNSTLAKKSKIQQGRFCVTNAKDAILNDLTDSFTCLPLSWRPKAMRFAGSDTKAFYNPGAQAFKSIEAEARAKVQGSLFGPEFLVYIPDCNVLATFFFMNPTMRRVAGDMKGQIGKVATVRSTLIETDKFAWHGPVITACSTPPTLPEGEAFIELQDRIKAEVDKFNNPPEEQVEEAPPEEAGTEERAR